MSKPQIFQEIDTLSADLASIATQQSKSLFGETSKYVSNYYDFMNTNGLNFQNFDLGSGVGSPWIIENEQITTVTTTGASVCWLPQKVQDGKISVVWENPNVDLAGSGFVGLAVKGDGVNNMILIILTEGTQKNLFSVYNVVNGALGTNLSTVNLSTKNDALVKTNIPSQIECEFYGKFITVRINGKIVLNKFTHALLLTNTKGYLGLVCGKPSTGKTFSSLVVSEKKYDVLPIKISKVLCAGDSITASNGWVSKLKEQLILYNKDVIVTNVGQYGATSAQVLNNQIIPNLGNGYEICTIQCGTNDTRTSLSIPIDTSISNLTNIIKELKSSNIIPIICTTTPFSPDIVTSPDPSITGYDNASYWYNVKLNALIRRLASKEKIRLIDNYEIFGNDFTLIGTDLLHPNNAGYTIISQNVLNVLTNKLL